MTDRFNSITVVLEKDIRTDDADDILCAIKQLRGVISAEGNVSDPMDYVTEERAKYKLQQKIYDIFK